ncbi:YicC/YloC family endoribonuclease [Alkalicoccus chagannorensis]|uniref:YicC/YloC family endoribonuclease n=1 Tax=Alkalicoccus chagannorensis TaxID=427072 RepID=UPI0003FFF2C0|nr:YicC/YloC family endoribonuclease [Alkalicoccus chagannorensis]
MIRSMTGFGRAEETIDAGRVSIEIKAVNHRFCETSVRLPRKWQHMEKDFHEVLRTYAERGKLEAAVYLHEDTAAQRQLHIDWQLLEQYRSAFEQLKEYTGSTETFPAAALLQDDALVGVEDHAAPAEEKEAGRLFQQAVLECTQMKQAEGKKLYDAMHELLAELETACQKITIHIPELRRNVESRLRQRVEEFLSGSEIREDRIMTEVAVYAEKSDIQEELTRMESHIEQFRESLDRSGAVGRRLDFLIQEMNREINTIGSKTGAAGMSPLVVDMKEYLEKMREQAQNIE